MAEVNADSGYGLAALHCSSVQETTFIAQLVPDESHMEGLANECTEVLVWHLHSEALSTSPFPHWSSPSKVQAIVPAHTRV